jgi:hypothetical protein
MGPITALFFVAATALSTPAEEAPPSHEEIMSQGARLVDAPLDIPEPVYETEDTEINCPPPTRLRCWMAADQDGGTPTVYCSCRR